jgi:hypothetical protein
MYACMHATPFFTTITSTCLMPCLAGKFLEALPTDYTCPDSSKLKLYLNGTWYTPCRPGDPACYQRVSKDRAIGRANMSSLVSNFPLL